MPLTDDEAAILHAADIIRARQAATLEPAPEPEKGAEPGPEDIERSRPAREEAEANRRRLYEELKVMSRSDPPGNTDAGRRAGVWNEPVGCCFECQTPTTQLYEGGHIFRSLCSRCFARHRLSDCDVCGQRVSSWATTVHPGPDGRWRCAGCVAIYNANPEPERAGVPPPGVLRRAKQAVGL